MTCIEKPWIFQTAVTLHSFTQTADITGREAGSNRLPSRVAYPCRRLVYSSVPIHNLAYVDSRSSRPPGIYVGCRFRILGKCRFPRILRRPSSSRLSAWPAAKTSTLALCFKHCQLHHVQGCEMPKIQLFSCRTFPPNLQLESCLSKGQKSQLGILCPSLSWNCIHTTGDI